MSAALLRPRRGSMLLEVLIALALVAIFAVAVVSARTQTVRYNSFSRKTTACSTLAQNQLELLSSLTWTSSSRPSVLTDNGDITSDTALPPFLAQPGSTATLPYPAGTVTTGPTPVNALGYTSTTAAGGKPIYYLSWHVDDQDNPATWMQMWVRCSWYDPMFKGYLSIIVTGYRFRSDL